MVLWGAMPGIWRLGPEPPRNLTSQRSDEMAEYLRNRVSDDLRLAPEMIPPVRPGPLAEALAQPTRERRVRLGPELPPGGGGEMAWQYPRNSLAALLCPYGRRF